MKKNREASRTVSLQQVNASSNPSLSSNSLSCQRKNSHQQQQQQQMVVSTKYHRAALDGYVDMLCEASKKDTNSASQDASKLTPTLLAAQNGHLEALRILVGRGGDPEKTSSDGSSALHLAAARNHLNCVSFLVNFGANMWALDNELHTAKDVAAIEQKKEVLDFLDQMMAKQSALNTKNVQKLKEKAKVSAEKRIKLMRKAQMKAIKQYEKDERYLVKLSNNRRLLKSAHSISDIKLVGRSCDLQNVKNQFNYSPADSSSACSWFAAVGGARLLSTAASSSSPLSSASTSSASSSRILGGSTGKLNVAMDFMNGDARAMASSMQNVHGGGVTNFFNQKLKVDLLNSARKRQQQLKSTSNLSSNNNSDESAYSSSLSSTSGYLSSCSTSAFSCASKCRPKYSDLVALNQEETTKIKSKPKKASSEQQSLKSNSTIGTKLRALGAGGGVSRKVQLKRMLLIGQQSNSSEQQQVDRGTINLNLVPSECLHQYQQRNSTILTEENNILEASTCNNNVGASDMLDIKQLCNVQTAKIKSNLSSESQQTNASVVLDASGGLSSNSDVNSSGTNIKWPPAPTLSRAISEPDSRPQEEDLRVEIGAKSLDEAAASVSNRESKATELEAEKLSQNYCLSQEGGGAELSKSTTACDPNGTRGKLNVAEKRDQNATVTSQHQLLTQCLSQLKLRHEAISRQQQHQSNAAAAAGSNSAELIRPSKVLAASAGFRQQQQQLRLDQRLSNISNNSDELIQHQINAGQFPLKPSLIKQQQQQQLQSGSRLVAKQQPTGGVAGESVAAIEGSFKASSSFQNNNNLPNAPSTTSTTISVDSIGSAGSLAKRNCSRNCSSKLSLPSSSSANSSSIASCSSSYSSVSSIEVNSTAAAALDKLLTCSGTEANERLAAGDNRQMRIESLCDKMQSDCCCDAGGLVETIDTFLLTNGLFDLSEIFAKEKIDLEALMLLSEEDLKSLNILLGPRRKLIKAIERRQSKQLDQLVIKRSQNNHHHHQQQQQQHLSVAHEEYGQGAADTASSMYLVVDTPL